MKGNMIFFKINLFLICYARGFQSREQDFQLLEAFSKRLLSLAKDNGESFILTSFDQERLIQLRTICKRLKHYNYIEKLISTMLIQVFSIISLLF